MNDASSDDVFGDPIHSYSRAQAIEDGALVDVSTVAREAGFKYPVAITRAAYVDCVQWTDEDTRRQVYQDEAGRLWDVLYMAVLAARLGGTVIVYEIHCVPRRGTGRKPRRTQLKMIVGPGDTAAPVITIMLPTED